LLKDQDVTKEELENEYGKSLNEFKTVQELRAFMQEQ